MRGDPPKRNLFIKKLRIYSYMFKHQSPSKYSLFDVIHLSDVDPGRQGSCVVAVINKFTQTTEVLWRKRDGMATL